MEVLANVRVLAAIIALLSGMLVWSCRHREPTLIPTDAVVSTDTSNLLMQLEHLGNIAYDHPEQYIHNPDSFLNLLSGMPTTAEGKEMYAWLLLNIGYALRESGNVLASARYYESAMEYIDANQLLESDFVDYVAKPLGNLYTQIGDLQRALHIHERAIQISKQRHDTLQLPSLYTNLAIVYQQLGRPDSVLQACRNGLAHVRDHDVNAALLYNIMANCYQAVAQLDTARHYNRLAIHQFSDRLPTGDTLIWYTSALYQACALDEQQDRLDQALRQINQAIALTERHFPFSKQRERAKYYYARGNLRFIFGDYAGAHHDFLNTLQLFGDSATSAHYPDHTFTEALWGLARVHTEQQTDSAIYYYRKAIENAFYTQQLIVSDASHYQHSAWNRQLLNGAMKQLWSAYETAETPTARQRLAETMCWVTELSKGRQLLHEINRTTQWAVDEDDATRRRLQYLFQSIATARDHNEKQQLLDEAKRLTFQFQLAEGHFGQSFAPPDFEAFMTQIAALSDSAILVSYFTSPENDGYYVAIANGKATAYRLSADSLLALGYFISRYFGVSPTAYDNDPSRYANEAAHWARLLLPPLATESDRRIILSPDGPLLKLPFDALIHGPQFIGETFNINYSYTFLLTAEQREQTECLRRPLRVFAKSRYADGELRDIPFVDQEAAYLSKVFGATVYRDASASDTTFFRALEDGGPIHIAAHAVADGPNGPYIAFDQPVTLDKLQYTRATAPFVFLSACQTASGQLLQGEGVESLNKAFLSKGVQGVVASYWVVDDETTASLTRLFYDALAHTGQPALALAEAKRGHIASASPSARNPWYWSSLQFTGVDVPVVLHKKSQWQHRLYVGLALAAIGCAGWLVLRRSKRPFNRKQQKAN